MMTPLRAAVMAGACLFAAQAAKADTTYIVDHVKITGSRTVPQEKLLAVVKSQPGAHVSKDDIIADQTAITKVLEDQHVGGSVSTSIAALKNHVTITFAVNDQGVQAPVETKVAPKLDRQVFTGNVKLATADLEAATGLKPGQDLSNETLAAAQAAILDAYKKAKMSVQVGASTRKLDGGRVEIDWQVAETAIAEKKKKKRDDREPGAAGFADQP